MIQIMMMMVVVIKPKMKLPHNSPGKIFYVNAKQRFMERAQLRASGRIGGRWSTTMVSHNCHLSTTSPALSIKGRQRTYRHLIYNILLIILNLLATNSTLNI